jgi:hypothetical protein
MRKRLSLSIPYGSKLINPINTADTASSLKRDNKS